MFVHVDTKNPPAAAEEVRARFCSLFPEEDPSFIEIQFEVAEAAFAGRHPGFLAIDTGYHDFEHTLQGAVCFARLIHLRHLWGADPVVTPRMFHLGLLAMLLHDTGYLKEEDDTEGTGAKYTFEHVSRSSAFAEALMRNRGYSDAETQSVCRMICCTGLKVNVREIGFENHLERVVGCCVGTADLVGQMAAVDYVERLPVLFEEFREASATTLESTLPYRTASDLIRQTPVFWEKVVLPRLEEELGAMHRFLEDPAGREGNFYRQQIEANLELIRRRFHDGPLETEPS